MNKNKTIPVFDISIGQKEKDYIKDCVDTSFIGQGFYVKKLEEKFSSFVDCKHGITTTSGTTALHLACAAIGIKKDDQVLIHNYLPLYNENEIQIDIYFEIFWRNTFHSNHPNFWGHKSPYKIGNKIMLT